MPEATKNTTRRILVASLIGTTIEYFDFYIYVTAAVLVFPKLFFPTSDPASARLQSLATFALAFFARPLGSIIFGHFGDRKGRKATLVAALMTMGPSTVAIGLLPDDQFISYGWRIPFIASALLVFVGLYVRLKIAETPDFVKVIEKNERVKLPFSDVFVHHTKTLILGTLSATTVFLLFYLMTVFTISWGTSELHYSKNNFLAAQTLSMVFFAVGILLSSVLADRFGSARMLIAAAVCIFLFGLVFSPLFSTGNLTVTTFFLALGMFLMGLTYGPLGTALASIFPPAVRYTGSSLAFTLAGILGASLTPALATKLASDYGLNYVGYYLSFAAVVTLIALVIVRKKMNS